MKLGNLSINPEAAAQMTPEEFCAAVAGRYDGDWKQAYDLIQKKYSKPKAKSKPKPPKKKRVKEGPQDEPTDSNSKREE